VLTVTNQKKPAKIIPLTNNLATKLSSSDIRQIAVAYEKSNACESLNAGG